MNSSDVIDSYSKLAQQFDSRYQTSPRLRERYEIFTRKIDTFSREKSVVLDLGCGSGVFSVYAAQRNAEVVGIDGSAEMLQLCAGKSALAKTGNVSFLKADIEALDIKNLKKVDLVICSSVLEYLNNFQESLKQVRSLMQPNGILIASVPNGSSFYRKLEALVFRATGRPRYYRHVKSVLTLAQLRRGLEQVGFELIEVEYFGRVQVLSTMFRGFGRPGFSDSLILFVAKKK